MMFTYTVVGRQIISSSCVCFLISRIFEKSQIVGRCEDARIRGEISL